jgi:hypothetical protein
VTAALTATSFPASQELLLLPQADILLTAVDREGLTPLKQYHRKPKHSFARDMMLEKSMELRHNAERKITEIKSHLQLVRAAGVTDGDTSRAEKQIIEARAVVNRLQTLEASSGLAETTLSMVSEAPEQSEADARAVEETRVRAAAEAVEADVLEIATFLEIDHTLHPDLLWIARKALFAEEDVPAEHFRELYAQRVRAKQRREGSMAAAIEAAVVTEAAPAIAPEITQTRIKPVGPSSLPISFEAVLAKKQESVSLEVAGDVKGAIKLLREAKRLEAQLHAAESLPSEAVVLTRSSPIASYGLMFDFSNDPTDGVVVLAVGQGSAAAQRLNFGDRLLAVDSVSITSGRTAMELIRNTSTEVRLRVRRANASELTVLQQRRESAEKQLHEAMCGDDQTELSLAISEARKAGVNTTAITAAVEHQTLEMQLGSAVRGTCTRYSYAELEFGTSIFSESNRIGGGGFGGVFRGVLATGEEVAVKRLEQDRSLGEASGITADSQFNSEVIILSRIAHEGIVRFLGWATESVPCLVYKLMEGSLENRLACAHGKDALSPYERVLIISDIGGGLTFLHVRAQI